MTKPARKVALLITRGDILGGAQVHLLDLALSLGQRGHRVSVLVGSEGLMTDLLAREGIPWRVIPSLVRPIRPLRDLRALRGVMACLREDKPDLLSTHTAKAGMIGRLAAWRLGLPVTFTAHGWQFAPGISPAQRLFVYATEVILSRLGRRQAVICVSEYDRALARRYRAVPEGRLHRIWNGLPDVPPARQKAASGEGEGGEPPVLRLIMPARFQAQKDHATLLRGLARLEEKFPGAIPWELCLPGDGERLEACREMVRTLGLPAERIRFPGHCHDLAERLPRQDILLLISHWEGLPLVLIEAMRAGLPVVASRVGGIEEVVVDGETGFLIPHEGVDELAERLHQLGMDPALRQQMGRAGRARYAAHFQLPAMLDQTVALWETLLDHD